MDINITPMLDIVFIMLIFFIVTTSFVKEPGIAPVKPVAETTEPKPRGNILIGVSSDGHIWMNNRRIEIDDVRQLVEDTVKEIPESSAIVISDQGARGWSRQHCRCCRTGIHVVRGRQVRLIAAATSGVLIALALFWLMHTLISGGASALRSGDDAVTLDFIQVDQDEIENLRKRTPPPKPEPPKKPPPPPKVTVSDPDRPQQQVPDIDMPKISLGIASGQGPYLGNWAAGDPSAEGDVIPIVTIEPQFPREALMNGIEGWVEIEFTIEPDGSVSNPRVIASDPRRIFDRNAIRAIYKWKFKPRIVDGKPVARQATQRLEFNLNQ